MKLEERVCSSELAKKLKELGVPQNSFWYWYEDYKNRCYLTNKLDGDIHPSFVSAFTVAELGEMLPAYYYKKDKSYWLSINKRIDSEWEIGYFRYVGTTEQRGQIIEADTEADARAKMLIYLIEKKRIKVENL